MRAVVQRVISSKVEVDGKVIGSIGKGLNVLLGISKEDTEEDIKYLKEKIINLRIFEDENEKLNKSLLDIGGDIIIVSQFTLYGDCRKGRRPSFIEALGGEEAYILYNKFIESIKKEVNNVATGEFGADMKVYIENDGPVTILLDSKKTF
ncbi:D-tyrosyl-tRNA(Tyr) deacylase [Clostridium botulinum]|uniref:D-aminoacyl-tRNA deacylase n=2 Tax=Clostridium botulinum TaxID=1491 RepID=DTD_CLOBM|nr:D-aminoacyl-tRNA deacylase [Clostridium botulinum]B1L0A0.1 RecName: Full=D-aminoacyl-tRNA deacylase; Short=DTD; AltName: Full=Gly-tRNA(Ala) deacylase [Clostridium botulinum A3 str. Loch Maree]ACA56704.1 D-tyrosyl-tRNA(Tyr) deacylase [Clostridium botulinum A3 str. Loch Maree]NFH65350.1 D-tyrosyl-tRNA(Tyr) deacylase [Clostridium botulinum]NFJ07919.1 D-tyrosyl-tRNA(Tyr) deacylase [Clostridium botulinum]NFK13291.1 D-tyrosyl-tRNA(Tyr) deacylase [Clostridium botulinum]NFM92585.1 D-tyrosyl-tRNA(T